MKKRADEQSPAYGTGRRGRSLPAALCGVIGKIILLLVILACLPVPVARMCGYEIYNVVSGSMEPSIPVGSAVFVRPLPPTQIEARDVIAFQSHGTVITHRVVENNTLESTLVTQGDANAQPDPEAIAYGNVVGRVERHVPGLGWLLSTYSEGSGRIYLICFAIAGALFSLIPVLAPKKQAEETPDREYPEGAEPQEDLQQKAAQRDLQQAAREDPKHTTQENAQPAQDPGKRSASGRVRRLLTILLAVIFVGSIGGYAFTRWRAQMQRQTYIDLAQQYVAARDAVETTTPQAPGAPPITVDFETLQAVNEDIAGWIYCEDTEINYPVMYGATNDTYLRYDYEKKYNMAGSIFIEAQNNADFSDVNTIIYGHHMNDGSMFAVLQNWQDPAFWDAHPVLWLFTPQQTYKIVPFSAYTTSAYSETYSIFSGPCAQMNTYLQTAADQSAVHAGIVPDGTGRYVLLSTCASAFDAGEARNVLHGVLEPVA